ncbi:MAG: tetratricopeptide repeat protein [Candidatus Aureabacteria bacterium]|nr:tetratricopeptide repeat protein [Candidatus Auribacterota bacterium]
MKLRCFFLSGRFFSGFFPVLAVRIFPGVLIGVLFLLVPAAAAVSHSWEQLLKEASRQDHYLTREMLKKEKKEDALLHKEYIKKRKAALKKLSARGKKEFEETEKLEQEKKKEEARKEYEKLVGQSAVLDYSHLRGMSIHKIDGYPFPGEKNSYFKRHHRIVVKKEERKTPEPEKQTIEIFNPKTNKMEKVTIPGSPISSNLALTGPAEIRHVLLFPGRHVIECNYYQSTGYRTYQTSENFLLVEFVADPGGRYRLECKKEHSKWEPVVKDQKTNQIISGELGYRSKTGGGGLFWLGPGKVQNVKGNKCEFCGLAFQDNRYFEIDGKKICRRCVAKLENDPQSRFYKQTEIEEGLKKIQNLIRSNQNQAALNRTESLLKERPDLSHLHYARAVCLYNLGRRDEALLSIREAEKLDPKDDSIRILRCKMELENEPGSKNYKQAEIQKILRDVQDLINHDRYEEAMKKIEEGLSYRQDIASLYHAKAICHLYQNQVDRGLQAIQKASELAPDNRNIQIIKEKLEGDSQPGSKYYKMSVISSRMNQVQKMMDDQKYNEALAEIDTLLTLRQDIAGLHHAKAVCYYHLKQKKEGLESINRALELEPSNSRLLSVKTKLELDVEKILKEAESLIQSKKYAEADQVLRKHIMTIDDDARFFFLKARCVRELEQKELARLFALKACKIEPNNPEYEQFKSELFGQDPVYSLSNPQTGQESLRKGQVILFNSLGTPIISLTSEENEALQDTPQMKIIREQSNAWAEKNKSEITGESQLPESLIAMLNQSRKPDSKSGTDNKSIPSGSGK